MIKLPHNMHIHKILLLSGLLLLTTYHLPLTVYADEISINASVDRNSIGLNEQLMLQVNVTGSSSNIPEPKLPALADFNAYSSGRSQNISIVNGKMSSSVNYRYALAPKTSGKFVIPPVTVEFGGKTFQTSPINIEVTAQSAAPAAAPQGQAPPGGGQAPAGVPVKDLFVTAGVNKGSVYVNEQVIYTFKFFRKIRLLANPNYVGPGFSGFWTENTPPKNYYTSVDGQKYLVTELSTVLFPTKPSKYTLEAAKLQCSIEDFSPSDPSSDAFFQSFFGGGKNVVLQTNPVTLNVLPLPDANKPGDFGGVVGQYTISSQLDRNSAKTNEAVTLSVTISGAGNIKSITEPKISGLSDFRKYETVSSLSTSNTDNVLKGSKTFKTVLVAQTAGQKMIPPIAFSFFDPEKKSYRTITAPAVNLTVKQGPAGQSPQVPASMNTSGSVKVLNSDIRYIKTLKKWKDASADFYGSPLFMVVNSLPFLALAGSFLFIKWREKLSGNVAYARRLKASPAAKKYLKKAKLLMKPEHACDFYSAISRSLVEYIAHKMNCSPDGLIFTDISSILSKKSVPVETINRIKEMLDECDMARFAPTQVTGEMMADIYDSAVDIIGKLEKKL